MLDIFDPILWKAKKLTSPAFNYEQFKKLWKEHKKGKKKKVN